ncbi:probable inactive purple acid phosphatase 16 isoform X2 [Phalaenopsis equestris]|uniref:probable inactive purple acid phosphatase 16 isoform X2 n=1 Tax=Phalaenopsis equestris TaxID=78828 RepID=UPI0009E239AF|nr:probable inactive purple acid phosphatase 16 isoform X2 [Phalaenopsis equestris]
MEEERKGSGGNFAEVSTYLQRFEMNRRKILLYSFPAFLIVAVAISTVSIPAAGGGGGREDGLGVGKGLRFSGSSSFKIALFADLHYGENAWDEWGPLQDVKSDRVISNVLDNETPDFVIYLGDVITANNLPTPNASLYWAQAISPTRNRGIPWATLFGNHDDAFFEWPLDWFSMVGIPGVNFPTETWSAGEKDFSFRGTTRIDLMKMEILKNPLSHSQIGPTELSPSVSNYILQISSSTNPKSPSVFLYFFDSGGGSYPEVISYAQVKWFQEQSQTINPYSRVPELIFWHIPSQAYKKVAPRPKASIKWPCVGSLNMEAIASQEAEWGIMDALSNRSSVKLHCLPVLVKGENSRFAEVIL